VTAANIYDQWNLNFGEITLLPDPRPGRTQQLLFFAEQVCEQYDQDSKTLLRNQFAESGALTR
jgi:hypothetical protein